jgi:SAM-dependent methyltransferase
MEIDVSGEKVLEFGCNIGATSILLAAMDARVTAIDINRDYIELAKLNAASYGVEERIDFQYVPDTTQLPFKHGQFDIITCNSVLEYVAYPTLRNVQREIDRVLKPDGLLVVSSTSNGIWPQEVHSRRWLVNYVPRAFDRKRSSHIQRGVSPLQIRFGFGPRYRDLALTDKCARYLEAKRRSGTGGFNLCLFRMAARLLSPLGISVGLLTPSISALLRKGISVGENSRRA